MDLNPEQRRQQPEPPRRSFGADFLVLALIFGGLFTLIEMGREFHHPLSIQGLN